MAPPRKPLDLDKIEELASWWCTKEEIAVHQSCSEDTLSRRCADLIKRGHTKAKVSLRARQFATAMGSPGRPAEYLRETTDKNGKPSGKLVLDKDGNPIQIKAEQKPVPPNVTMMIFLGKQNLGQADTFRMEEGDGFFFAKE